MAQRFFVTVQSEATKERSPLAWTYEWGMGMVGGNACFSVSQSLSCGNENAGFDSRSLGASGAGIFPVNSDDKIIRNRPHGLSWPA